MSNRVLDEMMANLRPMTTEKRASFRQESDRRHVGGLTDPLERLHSHDGHATILGLGEARHVRVDHAWRDRVDADAASRREMLEEHSDGAPRPMPVKAAVMRTTGSRVSQRQRQSD
jgi:hypothetical protein